MMTCSILIAFQCELIWLFLLLQKEEPQQKAEKKKPEAKKEEAPVEKKEKKQIAGGVSIEDLKVGSGPVAKAGKVVMVRSNFNFSILIDITTSSEEKCPKDTLTYNFTLILPIVLAKSSLFKSFYNINFVQKKNKQPEQKR